MRTKEAKRLLQNKRGYLPAKWELKAKKKALSFFEGVSFMQTEKEDKQLKAIKIILKNKKAEV